MLLSFGAENFYCFKESVTIDLTLNSKVPEAISGGKQAARALCLKGANASGKTNAVKILSFLSSFCVRSFSLNPDESIDIESYFGNSEPIKLFAEFIADGFWYRYELELTKNAIISEKLYTKNKRKTLALHRNETSVIKNTFSSIKDFTLRKNASIISTLRQYQDITSMSIWHFFLTINTNVAAQGMQGLKLTDDFVFSFYNNSPEELEFAKKLIKKFDTGITDIKIASYDSSSGEKIYFPIYEHETSDGPKKMFHASQSSGTKTLFKSLLWYSFTLSLGGVLALDEFDINLHPSILPHLIELFNNEEDNPLNAQIIISTHNNEIMDILGKYRTYLFNKRDGECFGYRLDEIESDVIRNDRPLLPLYQSGKLGGMPRI